MKREFNIDYPLGKKKQSEIKKIDDKIIRLLDTIGIECEGKALDYVQDLRVLEFILEIDDG